MCYIKVWVCKYCDWELYEEPHRCTNYFWGKSRLELGGEEMALAGRPCHVIRDRESTSTTMCRRPECVSSWLDTEPLQRYYSPFREGASYDTEPSIAAEWMRVRPVKTGNVTVTYQKRTPGSADEGTSGSRAESSLDSMKPVSSWYLAPIIRNWVWNGFTSVLNMSMPALEGIRNSGYNTQGQMPGTYPPDTPELPISPYQEYGHLYWGPQDPGPIGEQATVCTATDGGHLGAGYSTLATYRGQKNSQHLPAEQHPSSSNAKEPISSRGLECPYGAVGDRRPSLGQLAASRVNPPSYYNYPPGVELHDSFYSIDIHDDDQTTKEAVVPESTTEQRTFPGGSNAGGPAMGQEPHVEDNEQVLNMLRRDTLTYSIQDFCGEPENLYSGSEWLQEEGESWRNRASSPEVSQSFPQEDRSPPVPSQSPLVWVLQNMLDQATLEGHEGEEEPEWDGELEYSSFL